MNLRNRRLFFVVAYYDMDPRQLVPVREEGEEEFLLKLFESEEDARYFAEKWEYTRENGYEVFNILKGCDYDYAPTLTRK